MSESSTARRAPAAESAPAAAGASALVPHVRIEPTTGWSALNLREVWGYRDVLWMLVVRDVKLRYKQTALGIAWVVLQPLLAAAIFAVIFGYFARLPSDGQPYVVFVFCGLLGWNLFAGVLQRAGNSLVAESRLITKVYFPRLLIPLSAAGAALVDFAVALVVLAVLLAWFGIGAGWWWGLLPVALGLTLALAVGVSFWVSALNVRYRDFAYALPFLIQVWMYASPVVYGLALVGERWAPWFGLNPMVGALEALRQALLGASSLTPGLFATSAMLAVLALTSGAFFFRRVEREFADSL
jgi:lipopolysaccharide transport system permease protein